MTALVADRVQNVCPEAADTEIRVSPQDQRAAPP